MPDTQAPCKLVVLLSGNGSNLQAIIDRIEANELNARIVGVISDKADAHGMERAKQHDIDAITVIAEPGEKRHTYDVRLQAAIDKFQPDWIIMAGFMRILSDALVETYLGKMINIHPSLLPKFKGLNTHQRVLDAGEATHGASVHFVTPQLDEGPVIMQAIIDIDGKDSSDQLRRRVHAVEHRIYPDVIQLLCQQRVTYIDGKMLLDGKTMNQPLNTDISVTA